MVFRTGLRVEWERNSLTCRALRAPGGGGAGARSLSGASYDNRRRRQRPSSSTCASAKSPEWLIVISDS